jgi:hypothetical protein
MVNLYIPPIKMVMAGGWFMTLFSPHYHIPMHGTSYLDATQTKCTKRPTNSNSTWIHSRSTTKLMYICVPRTPVNFNVKNHDGPSYFGIRKYLEVHPAINGFLSDPMSQLMGVYNPWLYRTPNSLQQNAGGCR